MSEPIETRVSTARVELESALNEIEDRLNVPQAAEPAVAPREGRVQGQPAALDRGRHRRDNRDWRARRVGDIL